MATFETTKRVGAVPASARTAVRGSASAVSMSCGLIGGVTWLTSHPTRFGSKSGGPLPCLRGYRVARIGQRGLDVLRAHRRADLANQPLDRLGKQIVRPALRLGDRRVQREHPAAEPLLQQRVTTDQGFNDLALADTRRSAQHGHLAFKDPLPDLTDRK